MERHSSLGNQKVHRTPSYNHNKVGRVTSVEKYEEHGIIEVVFLDYGQPYPVWVVGDSDRKPELGDQVIVGYMDGRKDAPYLQSFVKNFSYTTNFVRVEKDKIRLQLPVFEIGVKDGKAHEDVKGHLLDESKKSDRAYMDITENELKIYYPWSTMTLKTGEARVEVPTSNDGSTPPALVKLTGTNVEVSHPTDIKVRSEGTINMSAKKDVNISSDTGTVNVSGTVKSDSF